MFIIQSVFFMIGLLGVSLVWGTIGFIVIALNEDKLELRSRPIRYLVKTVICGPFFIVFCYFKWKNKKE